MRRNIETEAAFDATQADRIARKVLAGSDTTQSVRDAGYAGVFDAALAMVGHLGDKALEYATALIVAEALTE